MLSEYSHHYCASFVMYYPCQQYYAQFAAMYSLWPSIYCDIVLLNCCCWLYPYRKLLDDESTAELLKEMEEAGCDTGSVAEVKAQLQEYLDKYNLSMPAYSSTSGELYAMSTLDEILSSAYEDTAEAVEANASALGIESDVADDDVDDDEDDDDAGSSSSGESELHDYTEEEWAALVGKYKKPALTELEQERDRIFSLFEYNMLENATCEDDLQQYQNIR